MTHNAQHHRPPVANRPTLAQVAEVARVSLKTASRALNDEPNVAETTKARVRLAADHLGFRLNGIARELRRGATSTLVGLISGDLANPFYSAVASGIERELRGNGLQLVMASNDEDPGRERSLVEAFLERRVRALLIMSTCECHDYLAVEEGRGVPFVFLDRPAVGLSADAVVIDNRGGGHQAGQHLLASGHRRIAVICDFSRYATHRDRMAGFAEAMAEHDNEQWRPFIHSDAHDLSTAEDAVRKLMAEDPAPTAIFTTNNRLTIGALRALQGSARPPALIGFDDFELGDVLGVTVVAHASEAMGRQAARLALDRTGGSTRQPHTVTIPTRVISRGSGERLP